MSRLLRGVLQSAHMLTMTPAHMRVERSFCDPARTQTARLQAILANNQHSAFGREHGFAAIDSVEAFRARVPVCDYDMLRPWIERVVNGETQVLTTEPVLAVEETCGSSAANKIIPCTQSLIQEFAVAVNAWILDLYQHAPALLGTSSYWAISPVMRARTHTAGGIPVGLDDDTAYLGRFGRWAMAHLMAVSGDVAKLPSVADWRRETLRQLVSARDLGLISVWSPTFLTLLMEALDQDWDRVMSGIDPRRRREIEKLRTHESRLLGTAIWPRLRIISCWADGPSADFLPALRAWFPGVVVQPKGLLATEGVISTPRWGIEGGPLAVNSHFLEFIDLETPDHPPRLAHELIRGGLYSPILTTGGGLYRYHLKDLVRCVGMFHATPAVRFEGRLDRVSDLCGEKLDARLVEREVRDLLVSRNLHESFCLLAPCRGEPPAYTLFIETDAPDAALELLGPDLDQALATAACHYGYCRRLGQLGAIRVRRVQSGARVFEAALAAQGQRIGAIKMSLLDHRLIWESAFDKAQEGGFPT